MQTEGKEHASINQSFALQTIIHKPFNNSNQYISKFTHLGGGMQVNSQSI